MFLLRIIIILLWTANNYIFATTVTKKTFKLMYERKTVSSSSASILSRRVNVRSISKCLLECDLDPSCFVVIRIEDKFECYLCKLKVLSELIDSTNQQPTTEVWHNPNKSPSNYWSIENDLRDYISHADLLPGAGFTTIFGPDRFGNPSGAIRLNNSYYQAPNGSYFSANFSILAWVKLITADKGARLIDFSKGPNTNNIAVRLVTELGFPNPSFGVGQSGVYSTFLTDIALNLTQWYHLAALKDGTDLNLYINGILRGSQIWWASDPPHDILTRCFIGHSAWYPSLIDNDANALFDDLKIFKRTLTQDEVLNDIQQ